MDISTLIAALVSRYPWGGSIVVLLPILGYALTHIFPMLSIPAPAATGFYPTFYKILSGVAGNWGNASAGPVAISISSTTGDTTLKPVPKQDAGVALPVLVPGAAPMVIKTPSTPLPLALIFASMLGVVALAACGVFGTSPTTPASVLNGVQAAYVLVANEEAALIKSGTVSQAVQDDMKAADTLVYNGVVIFRTAVESGKPVAPASVTALRTALTAYSAKLTAWGALTPATLSQVQTALALLSAYLTYTGA